MKFCFIDNYKNILISGSGTIDFIEFMTLMFRIQHGTIDLEDNRLGRAIMESKTQLTILQEIDQIHKSPPFPEVSVGKYGGCPVTCDFYFSGPTGTAYEGGTFCFHVKYMPGYPFRCPNVSFKTRIFNINVMTKINGEGGLSHIPHLWDCNWNSARLLKHVFDLLVDQDYSLIPPEIMSVATAYFKDDSSTKASLDDESQVTEALPFRQIFAQLARIEQVQANNVILHMGDRDRYYNIAREWTNQFATNKPKFSDEPETEWWRDPPAGRIVSDVDTVSYLAGNAGGEEGGEYDGDEWEQDNDDT